MFLLETRSAFEQERLAKKKTQRSHTLTRKMCNISDGNYTSCFGIFTNTAVQTQLRRMTTRRNKKERERERERKEGEKKGKEKEKKKEKRSKKRKEKKQKTPTCSW